MTGRTHDWSSPVDHEHLADVRRRADELAHGSTLHLVLEVLAYAAEEAEARAGGHAVVVRHADGALSVTDDGRGTQVRFVDGRPVRKPVMATRDLRLYDAEDPPLLPDGRPRRGISVVAALSTWLEHTNRRAEGAWVQRYESGVPVGDLTGVTPDGTTGTTVRFLPQPGLAADLPDDPGVLGDWPFLTVDVVEERQHQP